MTGLSSLPLSRPSESRRQSLVLSGLSQCPGFFPRRRGEKLSWKPVPHAQCWAFQVPGDTMHSNIAAEVAGQGMWTMGLVFPPRLPPGCSRTRAREGGWAIKSTTTQWLVLLASAQAKAGKRDLSTPFSSWCGPCPFYLTASRTF